ELDLDSGGMAGHRFVHRVVEDFRRQMVIGALIGAADIHARPPADRFQPLKDLDILGGVVAAFLGGRAEQIIHLTGSPWACRGVSRKSLISWAPDYRCEAGTA